ncbi:MAG TPA: DUF5312 family protein, partial [Spirochaetota bacterium]|nr:DUF5312 family protein [Spirochaetota bacterium]
MNYDSKFNKVIKSIPDDERMSLLDKFSRLSSSDESVIDKPASLLTNDGEKAIKQSTQDDYIDSIYQKTGFLNKVIITVMSLFTGKTKEELILDSELKSIRKYISLNFNNIVDFEREKFNSNFIKEIIDIPKMIDEIRKVLDLYFYDPLYYYGFLNSVIENSFPEKTMNALKELLPENIEITMDFMDKNVFLKEKDKRLKKFFSQFDTVFLEKL